MPSEGPKTGESKPLTEPYLDEPELLIAPAAGWTALEFRELWEHRELLYFLTWRVLKVRYRETVLGATWVLIQPLLSTLVFSLFFGRLAKIPSDSIPYPLFALSGLIPWGFFSSSLLAMFV
jgi:lipopolysaccharide transport system permease protein